MFGINLVQVITSFFAGIGAYFVVVWLYKEARMYFAQKAARDFMKGLAERMHPEHGTSPITPKNLRDDKKWESAPEHMKQLRASLLEAIDKDPDEERRYREGYANMFGGKP